MRKISIAAAAFVALAAFTAPASAATLILLNNGQDLTQTIHNNGGVDVDQTTVTFASSPSGLLVDYTSTVDLHYNGNSGGLAQITATNGNGIPTITITPSAS